jgi:4-hydroxy-tetrahydrodipicolinate reductase
VDDVCRLLESGANIVTSVVEFHHPESLDPAVRARVEEACRRGGSSLHSTGSSPGVLTEALPLMLCTMQRRLDFLAIDQFADLSERDSATLIFEFLGWGKKPADFKERQRKHVNDSFGHSFRLMAESMSIPLDRIETRSDYATARVRTKIAAGVLEAGTVAASRVTVTGYCGDRPVMRFCAYFYAASDVEQGWDLRPTGVRIQVQGDAPVDVTVTFPIPPADYRKVTPGLTAHPVINAIPAVCAAAPGIRTAAELIVLSVLG